MRAALASLSLRGFGSAVAAAAGKGADHQHRRFTKADTPADRAGAGWGSRSCVNTCGRSVRR